FGFEPIDGTSPRSPECLFVVRIDQRIRPDLELEPTTPCRADDLDTDRTHGDAGWFEPGIQDRKQAAETSEAHRRASSSAKRTWVLRSASCASAAARRSSQSSKATSSERTHTPLTTWSTQAVAR